MSCRIVLDNLGTSNPGGTVYGKLLLDFQSKESFRGIICTLHGREYTSWKEKSRIRGREVSDEIPFIGDNKFLLVNNYLVGEASLPPGHHEYPFSFTFPTHNIPGSYTNDYGYIKYYIEALVDKAIPLKDELTIDLKAPINFNEIRNELQLTPASYQEETILCCFCYPSDPITMNFALEKEAFVVGEPAKVKINILNKSYGGIDEMKLILTTTIESKVTYPITFQKCNTEVVTTATDTGVDAYGQRIYNFDFTIPPDTVIPNFSGCTLFKQSWILKAVAVVSGCHLDLESETSVKVGHIPVLDGTSPIVSAPMFQAPIGAFPPLPPVVSQDRNDLSYQPEKNSLTYPMGPSYFSVPEPTDNREFHMNNGVFSPLSPVIPQDKYPLSYHPEEKVLPYPVGPSSFSIPNRNNLGFDDGTAMPLLSSKEMSMPVYFHSGFSSASGPQEATTSSREKPTENKAVDMVNANYNSNPPPPNYQDSIYSPSMPAPSAPPN